MSASATTLAVLAVNIAMLDDEHSLVRAVIARAWLDSGRYPERMHRHATALAWFALRHPDLVREASRNYPSGTQLAIEAMYTTPQETTNV